MVLMVNGPSKWEFVTSATGGAGVAFLSAEGGKLYFKDPSGKDMNYSYGAAGVGLSWGAKLPKLGKIEVKGKSVGAVIAPADFPNRGKLFVLDGCPGADLTASDFKGVCLFAEIGGGLIAGVSATAMLLGMDARWLAALPLASVGGVIGLSYIDYRLLKSAKGLLVTGGLNAGVQAGAGVGAFIGAVI